MGTTELREAIAKKGSHTQTHNESHPDTHTQIHTIILLCLAMHCANFKVCAFWVLKHTKTVEDSAR